MNKVKILHVVNISFVIPYFLGDQITYFQDKNYEVFIACSPDDVLFEYQKKWRFKILSLNIKRSISIISDLICIYKLVKFIYTNKIDIVVGHTPKGGLIAAISSWICFVNKRIYFVHGLMFETKKSFSRRLYVFIEKLTCSLSNKVVCVSNSVLQNLIGMSITDKKKLFLPFPGSCNGIDTLNRFNKSNIEPNTLLQLKNKYGIDKNCKIVGFIGRLSRDKGINELVESWELIMANSANKKSLLVLCGPDDERDGIDEVTRNKILNNPSIIHLGYIENTELFYAIFDVFILPSYREGFPTVVLEASSMELPVITTRSTGCVDSIIDNHNGIFSDIDAQSLAKSIQFYFDNPIVARNHGMNGRDYISKYFEQSLIWDQLNTKLYS